MSDPSIQSLCCYVPEDTNSSLFILSHYNSSFYNIICLVSSLAGISGAVYQLLPRQETWLSMQWFSLTSLRGRQVIVWLALADLLAAVGVCLRSVVKLHDNTFLEDLNSSRNVIYCIILAVWIEYFYVASWTWTLVYALDTWLAVQRRSGRQLCYHCLAWLWPLLLTAIGLGFLYLPDADCHNHKGEGYWRILPNYLITYGQMGAVMVACPGLYLLASRHLRRIATSCLGQFTNKERCVVASLQLRFGAIVLSFYACWLPNIVTGILMLVGTEYLPKEFALTLWYMMAALNPLQALFNATVYRRPNLKLVTLFKSSRTELSETSPLIRTNINN